MTLTGKTVYKILDLTGTTWTRRGFHILIITEAGSISEYINCSMINNEKNIVSKTIRLKSGPNIKVLKKDESIFIYTD